MNEREQLINYWEQFELAYDDYCRPDKSKVTDTIAALRQQQGEGMVAVKAKWLVDNHDGVKDHACAECVPHSDMVIAGFRCYYHKALTMIAAKP